MKINWDRAPPDTKELQHFFTEESFKEWSTPCDLTDKIVTKFKELGSFHEFYWQKASAVDSSKLVNADVYCEQSRKPSGAVQLASNTDQTTQVQSVTDSRQSNSQKNDASPVKSQNTEFLHHKDWHVPYPRISWFTKSEQAFYVQQFLYFKNHKKLDDKAVSKYTELAKMHQRVHLEQEEFMDYLKLVSLKFKEHYAFLPPVAQRYMQEKYEVDLSRLRTCDQFYLTFDKVPIFSNKVTTHKFCDSKTVLEMGNVPACLLTNKKNKCKTVLDYKHLTSRYPIHQKTPGKQDSSWCHQVCSEDLIAEELAKKYQCDIVVSSSVLNCLVRNHSPGFKNNWDISVIIKNYNLPGPEGEFQHKVVYLNKPFYHSLNTREINSRFHKTSLASKILYPHHVKCFSFNSCNEADNSDGDDVDVTELETFGIGQSVKKTYEKNKRKEPQKQSTLAPSSNDRTTESAQNLSPTTSNEISGISSAIFSEKADHLEISEPLTDHLVSPSKDCGSFTSTPADRRRSLAPVCHYFPEESTSASEDSDHSSHLIIITDDNTDLDKSIDKTRCGQMADAVSKIISGSCVSVSKTVSAPQTSAVTVIPLPPAPPTPPSLSTLPVQEDIVEIPLQDTLDTPLQDSVETSHQDSVGAAQKDTLEIVLQDSSVEAPLQDGVEVSAQGSVETLQDTNEASLQDSVETLLEDTGKISLQDSVETPLQDMTKALLQDSEEASLQESMETPLQDTTDTPFQDITDAPLQDITDTPLQDITDTPLQDITDAPLQDITDAPLQDITETPLQDITVTPLQDITDTSLQDITETPLQDITVTPLQYIADTPLQDITETPLQDITEAPFQDITEAPLQDITDAPLQDIADAPLQDIADTPLQDITETPLQDITEAPLQDITDAPLQDITDTPLQDTTEAPLQDTTEAPLQDTTDAPLQDTTDTPLQDITDTPLKDITDAPLQDTTEAPLQDTTDAPLQDITHTPLQDITEAPVKEITETPLQDITDTPLQDITEAPLQDITHTPLQDITETPLQDITETTLQNITETPLQNITEIPLQDVTETPLQDITETPLQEITDTSLQDITDAPLQDITDAPLQDLTETPLQNITDTPLQDITDTPLQDITDTPLQDITDTPLQDITNTPLQDITDTPLQDLTEAPLQDVTEAPIQDVTEAPLQDITEAPLQDITDAPLQDITEAPLQDLTDTPVKDTPSSPDSERSYLHSLPFLEKEMKIIPTESDGNVFVFQDVPEENSSPVKPTLTSVPDEPSQFSHLIRNDNISYTVWNFGELRILVRSRYHAVKSKNKQKKTFLHLLPKLEYQSKFGYEETTQDELSKMWISSLIRKEIPVLKVRIDAFTSEILMYEIYNFPKILQKFNPVHCNTFLYNIFCKLHSLKSSTYLLSHCAGETSCMISEAVSNRPTILNCSDLYRKYSKNINAAHPLNVPWIPLDTQLLTPYHISNGRIPATFNPKGKRKWKKNNSGTSSQKTGKKAKRS
ncbi:uncharacterized protein LOC115225888 isoform X2 [Octopus sinensis]|uniref:Uncharacterized protein LOC115225888 isoform X2 n=1 Tax=Octopus sinensis TaxID=2607531 RepID=A0A7E6FSI2_9MOLL|nr:uncharacterized protein LOC115225888 isoform X2 [Octopus sinensis]